MLVVAVLKTLNLGVHHAQLFVGVFGTEGEKRYNTRQANKRWSKQTPDRVIERLVEADAWLHCSTLIMPRNENVVDELVDGAMEVRKLHDREADAWLAAD